MISLASPRLEVGHKPGRLLVAGAAEGEAAEGENVRRCAPLPHQVQGGDAAFRLLAQRARLDQLIEEGRVRPEGQLLEVRQEGVFRFSGILRNARMDDTDNTSLRIWISVQIRIRNTDPDKDPYVSTIASVLNERMPNKTLS